MLHLKSAAFQPGTFFTDSLNGKSVSFHYSRSEKKFYEHFLRFNKSEACFEVVKSESLSEDDKLDLFKEALKSTWTGWYAQKSFAILWRKVSKEYNQMN